jgi:hypothetical protein
MSAGGPVGVPVIYAAGYLALVLVERLVQRRHLSGTLLVGAEVPDGVAVEALARGLLDNRSDPE